MYLNISPILKKNRIAEIVEALESFDMDRAMTDFSMEACKKADLYPNIWGLSWGRGRNQGWHFNLLCKYERVLQKDSGAQWKCPGHYLLESLLNIPKRIKLLEVINEQRRFIGIMEGNKLGKHDSGIYFLGRYLNKDINIYFTGYCEQDLLLLSDDLMT